MLSSSLSSVSMSAVAPLPRGYSRPPTTVPPSTVPPCNCTTVSCLFLDTSCTNVSPYALHRRPLSTPANEGNAQVVGYSIQLHQRFRITWPYYPGVSRPEFKCIRICSTSTLVATLIDNSSKK